MGLGVALIAMALIILTASIGSRAESTSAINYALRCQTKEPKLRPHNATMWIRGGVSIYIYIYIHTQTHAHIHIIYIMHLYI